MDPSLTDRELYQQLLEDQGLLDQTEEPWLGGCELQAVTAVVWEIVGAVADKSCSNLLLLESTGIQTAVLTVGVAGEVFQQGPSYRNCGTAKG